jgi:hypothetical protein
LESLGEDGRAMVRPLYPREQTLAFRSSTVGYGANLVICHAGI